MRWFLYFGNGLLLLIFVKYLDWIQMNNYLSIFPQTFCGNRRIRFQCIWYIWFPIFNPYRKCH